MGSERTDLQRLYRQLEVIYRAGGRCEMKNVIEWAIDINVVCHIVVNKLKIRQPQQVRDVLHRAGAKIIHADDLVALRDEAVAKMATEKSGSAGDKCSWHSD